jgi:ATP-dependent helicase/nuclease subunit A
MTAPRDDRGQAVHERARNVIVDASAGTGKTSLVVERIVSLIAPHDGRDPVPIDRIAAITFTRKAAGELRVRTRQQILTELATTATEAPRAQLLHRALAGIDTAQIGTIHGFADRLLRLWPAQARLDPRYELDDDVDRRVEECFQLLLHGAETSTLVDSLRGSPAEPLGAEATATILDAQRAGLRTRSLVTEHWTYHGLDGLVAGFVHHRDAAVPEVAPVAFDQAAFDRTSHEYLGLIDRLSAVTRGERWLLETGELLRRAGQEPDPVVRFRELVEWIERGPRGRASDKPSKKHDFGGDDRAWDIWKIFVGDDRKKPLRDAALRDDLLSPLRRWFAIRLARLRPVVLHIYEQVKARHRVVDHIDLLLRLRDLLRGDLDIRRSCQQMFDHLFVDEFQDTDPLQAEIVMFLCEQGTDAATWEQVTLSPGRLTIVGDPKQSIYRFRRADIATYQRVVEIVERAPHLAAQLSASYRSAPRLVEWLNARFASILGHGDPGERFRHRTGEVFHQPLTAGRTTGSEITVHAVPFDLPAQGVVADSRALEAEAMARYMRWLVGCSGIQIADPVTGEPRSIGFGDIGVLAMTTTQLRVLFDALDRDDVPYAARGGAVFLADPLQKHFLLGLCALADRDDGVALAAILRPPFFAVDLGDLARARDDDPDDRANQARAIVRELRRRRFERGPGATARALLEETGFGRMIALGPNGSQRLSSIRELCFQVEARALRDRLDFDGTMEQLRDWIDRPPRIDRPPPVSGEAVRIMTVHQAKGLEFPVVVLWDASATWKEPVTYDAWSVDRDGRGWSMRLDTLRWDEPADLGILAVEHTMRQQERKRLVYVAATRARDLLVIPQIGAPDDRMILGTLVLASSPTVLLQPLHTAAAHATWFDAAAPAAACAARESSERDVELRRELDSRVLAASQSLMRPSAFTDAADPRFWWGKQGRYGTVFGETVHLAIGFALQRGARSDEAVRDAASRTGLSAHLAEAVADTNRALGVLATLGLAADGQSYAVEYPIAGLTPGGGVVAGYIDLVAGSDAGMVILDFKTDTPPSDCQPPSPRYVEQVTGYAAALRRALDVTAIRAGLLFTADGSIHWLSSGDNAGG